MGTGTRCVRDTHNTDKDAHITCQAAAVSGPHRAPQHPEPQTHRKHGLPRCARTSPWPVAPAKRPSRPAPRFPDAASLHPAEATQTPAPSAARCLPARVRDAQPRPLHALRAGGSQTPQCAALRIRDPMGGAGAAGVSLEKLRQVQCSRRAGRGGD